MNTQLQELATLAIAYIDAEPSQQEALLNALVEKRNEIAQAEAAPLPEAWELVRKEYLWLRGHVANNRISHADAWLCIAAELEAAINPQEAT